MPDQITIAIDPGTVDCGLAVMVDGQLQHYAKLHAPERRPLHVRMALIMGQLSQITTPWVSLNDDVDLVYERPIYMRSPPTAHMVRVGISTNELWMLIGAMVHWANERDYRPIGYDVDEIKEGIGGKKNASKAAVMASLRYDPVVSILVGDKNLSDHEWDAISVAIYHQAMRRVQAATIEGDPRVAIS